LSKQGLLLIESPEPRYELFCRKCYLILDSPEEYQEHSKLFHNWDYLPKLPMRPLRRLNATQEELFNLRAKKCWCGKERKDFNQWQIKYCTPAHSTEWMYEKTPWWSWYKNYLLQEHRLKPPFQNLQHCDLCETTKTAPREVDHIIAISNGGHPWHKDNIQIICEPCHKEKTREDMRILRENRKSKDMIKLENFTLEL